jgi:hypothetical protein
LPVFPLPSIVFFPGTVLPLHIFEDRYKQMVRDARGGAGIIAMALLREGWEPEYYGSPEVYRIGCAGEMSDIVPLPEGRFNIKLRGLSRVRLVSFEQESPYRIAVVEPLPERAPAEVDPRAQALKRRLVQALAALVAGSQRQAIPVADLGDAPLPSLVNTLCARLDLPLAVKQELLTMDDLLDRCTALTRLLGKATRRRRSSVVADSEETIH